MAKQNKIKSANSLRIIAGKWRGRKLSFPDIDGLRPTPDRVRETVFNWLQPIIGDARCLDLFAGSGALGFEAASRGAQSVDMVELDTQAFQQLNTNRQQLLATQCHVLNQTAQTFLGNNKQQYDVVFIDPPYQADLWSEIANMIDHNNLLVAKGLVYLECPAKKTLPVLPEHWQLLKEKKAGEVRYCLYINQVGDSR